MTTANNPPAAKRKPALKPKPSPKPKASPNKGGRPKVLTPDEATLRLVVSMGKFQAIHTECAAVLGVSLPTFKAFLQIPAVADALETGKALGRASLRRKQFEMALAGNTTMLIWTGKNILGQMDKLATEHTGKDGGPIQHSEIPPLDYDKLSLDEKRTLLAIMDKAAIATSPADGADDDPTQRA